MSSFRPIISNNLLHSTCFDKLVDRNLMIIVNRRNMYWYLLNPMVLWNEMDLVPLACEDGVLDSDGIIF